ncbi:hypothetical protein FXW07_07980 [Methanosarcina sp. DH1]|uniref:hypothetical protein n=1 Tax=Methanosarcina sp. DH1 TaxID=2605695 RepID=UPI001E3F579E|nr:hypothetical protein [Methanosarcina sp. DH1]MCC4766556.1 hypothetical protein [Methanosarcina sp. DH1]
MKIEGEFDEKESFNFIKNKFSKIEKMVSDFKKINFNDADSIEKLEKYIQKIPELSDLNLYFEDLKKELQTHVVEAKRVRSNNFRKAFNDYINWIQEEKRPYRIMDKDILRVGVLEVQTNPKDYSVSFFFNKQILMSGKKIRSEDGIIKYEQECLEMLKKAEIPEKDIENIFYNAYGSALRAKKKKSTYNHNFVPIIQFYKNIQIELFKNQLENKKPGSNISIEFPVWALLYNLDIYRKMKNISDEKRIFFETGNQAETQKNGVVLNGLDPHSNYKMFCYIRGSGDS